MSPVHLSRRSLLKTSLLLAATTGLAGIAAAQQAAPGGRLIVAADSEPKNLNPAIVASNGVFYIASKIIEPLAEASFNGKDGLEPRLATGGAPLRLQPPLLRQLAHVRTVLPMDRHPFAASDEADDRLRRQGMAASGQLGEQPVHAHDQDAATASGRRACRSSRRRLCPRRPPSASRPSSSTPRPFASRAD